MKVALDTNAYSDFMRGDAARVRIVRAARAIAMPLIVLGELRTGFAAGSQQSSNTANLQRFFWRAPESRFFCPTNRPRTTTPTSTCICATKAH